MKEEIFAELVKIVSRETEITREMIVSKCSKAEVVDARYILARLLHDAGFYKSQIAERLCLSRRSVFVILGSYMITASCDPYHANTKYHGEEVIRYDGKTPIEWIVDDFFGAGYTEEDALKALEDIVGKKDCLSYYEKNVFETYGEEIPEWFNGDGYYDDEMCVYNVGDRTYRDDVLYYSIEEMAEGEK